MLTEVSGWSPEGRVKNSSEILVRALRLTPRVPDYLAATGARVSVSRIERMRLIENPPS